MWDMNEIDRKLCCIVAFVKTNCFQYCHLRILFKPVGYVKLKNMNLKYVYPLRIYVVE